MLLRRLLYPLLLAPATEEGALDAMNKALEEQAPPPAAGDGNGDEGGEGGEAAGGEGGEAGSGDGGAPAGDAETREGAPGEQAGGEGADGGKGGEGGDSGAAAAPKPGEAGSRHRADGTFKSKEELERDQAAIAAAEAARAPAGKKAGAPDPAAADPAKGGKKGKVDHINDPIPDELKGRTRERLEGLVATAKDLTTKLEAQTQELESGRELFGMIEATGADAQTFARHMDVLAAMNSPDPATRLEAVKLLRAAADKIGTELGETPAGKDPLEGHQDLLDEVDAGEITRKRAEELAGIRNREAAAAKLRTEAGNRNTEQQQAEQRRAETKTALNALSDELRKKDGAELYARKHAILVPFIRRLNPALTKDQVVVAVREAYNALTLGPAAKPAANGNRAPAGTGNRQPARALQGAGAGGAKAPTSALEAMDLALDEHARTQGRVA